LESICLTKTRAVILPLFLIAVERSTFRSEFHRVLFVKDTYIGAVRCFVEIFEDFVSLMGFIVKEIWSWSGRDAGNYKNTQETKETHFSRIVEVGEDMVEGGEKFGSMFEMTVVSVSKILMSRSYDQRGDSTHSNTGRTVSGIVMAAYKRLLPWVKRPLIVVPPMAFVTRSELTIATAKAGMSQSGHLS
jgi:hypothetical protein